MLNVLICFRIEIRSLLPEDASYTPQITDMIDFDNKKGNVYVIL